MAGEVKRKRIRGQACDVAILICSLRVSAETAAWNRGLAETSASLRPITDRKDRNIAGLTPIVTLFSRGPGTMNSVYVDNRLTSYLGSSIRSGSFDAEGHQLIDTDIAQKTYSYDASKKN